MKKNVFLLLLAFGSATTVQGGIIKNIFSRWVTNSQHTASRLVTNYPRAAVCLCAGAGSCLGLVTKSSKGTFWGLSLGLVGGFFSVMAHALSTAPSMDDYLRAITYSRGQLGSALQVLNRLP